MAQQGKPVERSAPPVYDNEVERLCGYLKNDSLVRWSSGCSQAQVVAARARIAARRPFGSYGPKGDVRHEQGDTSSSDMAARQAAARRSNQRFLAAIQRAGG